MKPDNQHLEFLISQHVDGCLDSASRKSLEQRLLTDPETRTLYAGQRETQDLLEDWGSRIPLIDWDEFDTKLAGRLAREQVGKNRERWARGWVRKMSVAAALLLAALAGYAWHGMSGRSTEPHAISTMANGRGAPRTGVQFLDGNPIARPSHWGMTVDEPGQAAANGLDVSQVALGAPNDAAAVDALRETVSLGTENLPAPPKTAMNNSVVVAPSTTRPANADQTPFYP